MDTDHRILYPTKDEIIAIHEDIITEDDDAEPGILNEGDIDYVLNFIENGHFGQCPDTIHKKAVELLRLISANHPFADGNKRTALNATWTFYALNGHYLDYGEEIKAILKLFAVMERMVDKEEVIDYFSSIVYQEDDERVPSEMVKLLHLPKWHSDYSDRLTDAAESKGSQDIETAFEFIEEHDRLKSEFDALADELSDLPEEVTELIEHVREENRRMQDMKLIAYESQKEIEEKGEDADLSAAIDRALAECDALNHSDLIEALERFSENHPEMDVDELRDDISEG